MRLRRDTAVWRWVSLVDVTMIHYGQSTGRRRGICVLRNKNLACSVWKLLCRRCPAGYTETYPSYTWSLSWTAADVPPSFLCSYPESPPLTRPLPRDLRLCIGQVGCGETRARGAMTRRAHHSMRPPDDCSVKCPAYYRPTYTPAWDLFSAWSAGASTIVMPSPWFHGPR